MPVGDNCRAGNHPHRGDMTPSPSTPQPTGRPDPSSDATDVTGPLKGRSWVEVWYHVRTGIDDDARPLRSGSLLVAANSEVQAVQAGVQALHANDPACDPRLDPRVECVGSFVVSVEEAEGWLGERDLDLSDVAEQLEKTPAGSSLVFGVRTGAVEVVARPPRRPRRS